jgi:hypothetical protein
MVRQEWANGGGGRTFRRKVHKRVQPLDEALKDRRCNRDIRTKCELDLTGHGLTSRIVT